MKISEATYKCWIYCENEDAAEISEFKLHVALPISEFDNHHDRIYDYLKTAVENGIIP